MKSFRTRQLITSFGILMVSILILGTLLYIFTQRSQIELEQAQMESLGFDLIGYLNYENNKFIVNEDSRDELERLLKIHSLSNEATDNMAYIQNLNTSLIHWHSLDPQADLYSKQPLIRPMDKLITFPIRSSPGQHNIKMLSPEINHNLDEGNPKQYLVYSYGFKHDNRAEFQLVIARTAEQMVTSQKQMVKDLVTLFIISAILVSFLQLATSYWVIAPIKDFDEEIKRIESGLQESIINQYPQELEPVKNTINALLQFEKGQKRRFRDSLDDLAHSLKTPLAAMNSFLTTDSLQKNDKAMQGIMKQVTRMKKIISYQLRKAIVSNQNALAPPLIIRPILTRLRDSLYKVYHEKNFTININVEDNLVCRLDEDDMMEVFGNLMNNACRFCEETIDISARQDGDMIVVDIDDDGMGFPNTNPSQLLKRGIRYDNKTEGQGIGLAVTTEITIAAGGKIELLVSPQVGARVRIHLPS